MSAVLDMSDAATRERIEVLQRGLGGADVDLTTCCDFLLGVPTFAGITADYARTAVTNALDAQAEGDGTADPGAIATGPIEPGTTTGEEE